MNGTIRDLDTTTDDRAIEAIAAISGQSLEGLEIAQTSPAPIATSGDTTPNDPSTEDTQAASILSSIPRNPLALQSRQGMSPPDEPSDLSPLRPTNPLRLVNEGSSYPPNVRIENIPQYSTQAAAKPRATIQLQQLPPTLPPLPPAAQTPEEWAHPSMDFTRSIPRQDNHVFELAPFSSFSSWELRTYEDPDWGAALRGFTFGDPSLNGFTSLEWDLLIAADREDDTIVSGSN